MRLNISTKEPIFPKKKALNVCQRAMSLSNRDLANGVESMEWSHDLWESSGLFCRDVGLFCRDVGLFCGGNGVESRFVGVFSQSVPFWLGCFAKEPYLWGLSAIEPSICGSLESKSPIFVGLFCKRALKESSFKESHSHKLRALKESSVKESYICRAVLQKSPIFVRLCEGVVSQRSLQWPKTPSGLESKSPIFVGLFCKRALFCKEPYLWGLSAIEPSISGSLQSKSPIFVGLFCKRALCVWDSLVLVRVSFKRDLPHGANRDTTVCSVTICDRISPKRALYLCKRAIFLPKNPISVP